MHAIAAKTLDLSCEVSGLLTKSCEAGGSWKNWSWTNSLNFSRLQFPSTSWHLCTTCPSIQARGEPSRRCWRVGKSKAALENLPGSPTVWKTISLYPCSWSTIFKEGNNAECDVLTKFFWEHLWHSLHAFLWLVPPLQFLDPGSRTPGWTAKLLHRGARAAAIAPFERWIQTVVWFQICRCSKI